MSFRERMYDYYQEHGLEMADGLLASSRLLEQTDLNQAEQLSLRYYLAGYELSKRHNHLRRMLAREGFQRFRRIPLIGLAGHVVEIQNEIGLTVGNDFITSADSLAEVNGPYLRRLAREYTGYTTPLR